MTNLYQHIADTIRDLRTKYGSKGISQEALATQIGEPANTVSRWETATYKPSAEQLDKLARFFGVSIVVFFPGMESDSSVPQALTSATRGLTPADLEEVIRYAEFRRARAALEKAGSKGKIARGSK
jgi:transcriptional regulator with XRE-family HTH domain